jgi:AcrR family transcriptional regulator
MPKVLPRRQEASAHRRNAILKAARAVFARQGYQGTGVEDIAVQAGIAKGTLYLYFPSKEQIYFAALVEDARRLDVETRDAMIAAADWREAIRAYVMVRLRYFDVHSDFLRIFVAEFRSMCILGRPLNAELFRLIEDGVAQLAQVLAAASARHQMRPVDPELVALTVADLTRGLMERRLRQWGRSLGPGDADFALDLICRGLEPSHPPD